MIAIRKPGPLTQETCDSRQNGRQATRGGVTVEFALLLIPLLFIVFGVAEYGRALYQYNTLVKAVRDSVRYISSIILRMQLPTRLHWMMPNAWPYMAISAVPGLPLRRGWLREWLRLPLAPPPPLPARQLLWSRSGLPVMRFNLYSIRYVLRTGSRGMFRTQFRSATSTPR